MCVKWLFKYDIFNNMLFPYYFITCRDVCVTTLVRNFLFVLFFLTYFDLQFRPSSQSFNPAKYTVENARNFLRMASIQGRNV